MIAENKIDRIKELIPLLNKARQVYEQESREIMSNREYDALYDELSALEQETGLVFSDSPTQNVGYETVTSLPKKAHAQTMLSQNKTKSVEELQGFLGQQPGLLSWKLDGLTVVLSYEGGSLQEAVTRGDGRVGAIVTSNARAFQNIPLRIPFTDRLTLRGEAIISYPDFEEINRQIPEGEARYKNPRNLCSGSVLQFSSEITARRRVQFVAFSLVEAEGLSFALHSQELDWLRSQGFEVVPYEKVDDSSLPGAVDFFKEQITAYPLPSDGLVLLMDDIPYGRSLGTTAKFPRDSIAFKWEDETALTRLIRVEWSASRTGLINPVAVFEPVELEGTTVSRASVHNLSVLEDLALGEGDEITVYKANMIIPQISENLTRSATVKPPDACPVCGSPTRIFDSGEAMTLYCDNRACPAKELKRFELFVSRNALNIEGLSQATLEKLVDNGLVKEYADLFRLEPHRDTVTAWEGFGDKSFDNLLGAAKKASKTTLPRLLTALGISGVGPATARLLDRYFHGDLEALRKASREELQETPEVGPMVAEGIRSYFEDPQKDQELDALLPYLEIEGPRETEPGESTLSGLVFVITGALFNFPNREALKERIEALGGKVSGSVSAKTTALINNDALSNSSKNQSAKKLGIRIITEEEFLEEYGIHP